MNVEYQFVGTRRDNVKMPGTESVPRPGDCIFFIDEDGSEETFYVRYVHHIHEVDEIRIQVVIGDNPRAT